MLAVCNWTVLDYSRHTSREHIHRLCWHKLNLISIMLLHISFMTGRWWINQRNLRTYSATSLEVPIKSTCLEVNFVFTLLHTHVLVWGAMLVHFSTFQCCYKTWLTIWSAGQGPQKHFWWHFLFKAGNHTRKYHCGPGFQNHPVTEMTFDLEGQIWGQKVKWSQII